MALMRKEDPTTTSSLPGGPHSTILGREASFDGKLVFQGSVRIEGTFGGEITTEDVLLVDETAEVTASLNVGTLSLKGTLRGNVRAKKLVELHAPARIYGDIETPNLIIHSGVIFEGNCRMESVASKPEILTKSN